MDTHQHDGDVKQTKATYLIDSIGTDRRLYHSVLKKCYIMQ